MSDNSFKIFLGHYEIIPCGLGSMTIWHHNPNINIDADEQYRINKKNFDDFECFKTQESCLTIVTG